MPARKEQTSFQVSENLKTALINSNRQAFAYPSEGRSFYDGSANTRLFCVNTPENINGFSTIEIANNQVSFNFLDFEDLTVTRIYTVRELEVLLVQVFGNFPLSNEVSVKHGNTWTYSIDINLIKYTGTGQSEADAKANAIISALNANSQQLRQG